MEIVAGLMMGESQSMVSSKSALRRRKIATEDNGKL